jgi:hypothetical protein
VLRITRIGQIQHNKRSLKKKKKKGFRLGRLWHSFKQNDSISRAEWATSLWGRVIRVVGWFDAVLRSDVLPTSQWPISVHHLTPTLGLSEERVQSVFPFSCIFCPSNKGQGRQGFRIRQGSPEDLSASCNGGGLCVVKSHVRYYPQLLDWGLLTLWGQIQPVKVYCAFLICFASRVVAVWSSSSSSIPSRCACRTVAHKPVYGLRSTLYTSQYFGTWWEKTTLKSLNQ